VGGGVKVNDDDNGEVEDDGLEVWNGGGVLEVDSSMLWAQGWQTTCLRSMAACSGSRTRQRRSLRLRSRRWHALTLGTRQLRAPRPRMVGNGGVAVSRAIEERQHFANSKNC
jgi:hypothetical protein